MPVGMVGILLWVRCVSRMEVVGAVLELWDLDLVSVGLVDLLELVTLLELVRQEVGALDQRTLL